MIKNKFCVKYYIIELNTLNKLKGINEVIEFSVNDPKWKQEEMPERLITVEPNEVIINLFLYF